MANQNNLKLLIAAGNRVLAAIFLIYLAPVLLMVAFLIKIETSGPVLARRSRCLSDRKPIDLWEFRTTALTPHGANRFRGGERSALGIFLRGTRLDLLPRLVNMLRGEVTVGLLFR